MTEVKKETRKDALARLFTTNGLVKEDVYKDKRGFVIITRTGIDKIISNRGIQLQYEPIVMERDWVVLRCTAQMVKNKDIGQTVVESFGEASKENTMGLAGKFPVAMAEKRAKSRAVLMLTGFYEQGIYGQDEMTDE
ncbi:hypothetical protein [Marinobacter sp.]|uniref:hypothetical protein n=1 Tax=Marinobacter sp. TaxID=50741 RepID=UPI000C91E16C|nr:hypothetical protein [Marinobacter sp.]MAB51197.1 hypothetical protein [Marinobacter sp.]|tara:strand:- start:103 stop:513 length:411 start_codon:yes stop_codon:yes gene_type:complete